MPAAPGGRSNGTAGAVDGGWGLLGAAWSKGAWVGRRSPSFTASSLRRYAHRLPPLQTQAVRQLRHYLACRHDLPAVSGKRWASCRHTWAAPARDRAVVCQHSFDTQAAHPLAPVALHAAFTACWPAQAAACAASPACPPCRPCDPPSQPPTQKTTGTSTPPTYPPIPPLAHPAGPTSHPGTFHLDPPVHPFSWHAPCRPSRARCAARTTRLCLTMRSRRACGAAPPAA